MHLFPSLRIAIRLVISRKTHWERMLKTCCEIQWLAEVATASTEKVQSLEIQIQPNKINRAVIWLRSESWCEASRTFSMTARRQICFKSRAISMLREILKRKSAMVWWIVILIIEVQQLSKKQIKRSRFNWPKMRLSWSKSHSHHPPRIKRN